MHQTAKFMPCSALALCQEFLFAETIRQPKETDRRVSVCRINMAAKKTQARHLQQSISSDLSTQSSKPSQTSEAFTHWCSKTHVNWEALSHFPVGRAKMSQPQNTIHVQTFIQKEFAWPKLLFYPLQISFTKCVIMAPGRQFKNMFGS